MSKSITTPNGEIKQVGLNGEVKEDYSEKSKKSYKYYELKWIHEDGKETQIKRIFLSDLELQMIDILTKSLMK